MEDGKERWQVPLYGGEIEFPPPGRPLPGFDLKIKVNNKKPNY